MSGRQLINKRNESNNNGGYGIRQSTQLETIDNDDGENDDYEYLQEIPYSSSSVDRSSIGSIPWAEDAIKQNQLDWERVERMISGEEPLPDEPELRNEIQDWQRKFPQLLGKKNVSIKHCLEQQQLKSFDSNRTIDDIADDTLDFDDTLTSLSENSIDENDEYDNFDSLKTPTHGQLDSYKTVSTYKQTGPIELPQSADDGDLINLFDNGLHITESLSHKPRKLSSLIPHRQSRDISAFTPRNTNVLHSNKHLTSRSDVERATNASLRMPTITNVYNPSRQYKGIEANRSFIQLTQIDKARSAAERHKNVQRISTWRSPSMTKASNNVLLYNNNNRNSIVLPAIKAQFNNKSHLCNREGAIISKTARTNSSSLSSKNESLFNNLGQINRRTPAITNSSLTSPTGRSVSAAVQSSRLSCFYLPNSASKYKVFK